MLNFGTSRQVESILKMWWKSVDTLQAYSIAYLIAKLTSVQEAILLGGSDFQS
jgi:hypothetical protein